MTWLMGWVILAIGIAEQVMPRWLITGLAAIIALIAAAALGWWLGQPGPVVESRAAEQRQIDGSLVLERLPDTAAKPAQQVPAGAKAERVGRVVVKPATRPLNSVSGVGAITPEPCPPVTVDWSLVREQDGGRRFLASSPDGTIVGGVDVPIETAAPPPKPLRWAAGLSWSPTSETSGVWIERDVPVFGRALRVGAEINQDRIEGYATGVDARLRVGFTF